MLSSQMASNTVSTNKVRVQSIGTKPKKNGELFVEGQFINVEGDVFKLQCWEPSIMSGIEAGDVIEATGKASEFMGTVSWNIERATKLNATREEVLAFIPQKIGLAQLEERFWGAVSNSTASETAVALLRKIFSVSYGGATLWDYFNTEFAAINHHDNQRSGLLSHTTKCLEILNTLISQHTDLFMEQETVDLMVIGTVLHDLGKIKEYNLGAATELTFVSHRALGSELLYQLKSLFVQAYSVEFFYHIIALVNQHHGEYEEKPRTVYAALLSLVDGMEAMVTGIAESCEINDVVSVSVGDKYRKVNKASWDYIEGK